MRPAARRPYRLSETFRPSRRRLRRVVERMHRCGRLPCQPQSALEAVIAVHDVLRAEGRPLDPAVAPRAEVDESVLRAVEVREMVLAGVWP